jgi:hypothetical protein
MAQHPDIDALIDLQKSSKTFVFVLAAIVMLAFGSFLTVREGWPTEASGINVCNATGVELKAVQVGGKPYGDLAIGATSGFQTWAVAYRYAAVSARIGDHQFSTVPDDFNGEKPLGAGQFTYVIVLRTASESKWLEATKSQNGHCQPTP